MAKARKTRQQKELADKRRVEVTPSGSYSLPEQVALPTLKKPTPSISSSVTSEYGHVRGDLLHTLIITGIIVAFQVVLLFILN